MKQTTLNDDVRELFERQQKLNAELNEVSALLAKKRRLLIRQREVETAAHDVWRQCERRTLCVQ